MLTIYAPFNNKNSKAWEVFNGVEDSWPDQIVKLDNARETEPVDNSMFWGFVGNNREMVKSWKHVITTIGLPTLPTLEDLTTTT